MPEAYDSAMDAYTVEGFGMHPSDVIKSIGIKRWRIAATYNNTLGDVLGHLEGFVRHTQGDTLGVIVLDKYKFIDSLDPKGEGQPWAYLQRADPAQG